jgi:hypothetical protein
MKYRYSYPDPYQTPPPPRRDRRGWVGPVIIAGAILASAAGVGTWVLLERLSDEVLAILATVGCASGVTIPTLVVAVIVLLRRAENGHTKQQAQQPGYTTTPPQVMILPPMQLPHYPAPPQQPASTWEEQRRPRHFTVMGDD